MGTELLLYLGSLALLDTLSPTIIGVTLFLLLRNKSGIASRLFTYLLTVATLYAALGIGLMLSFTFILDAFSSLTEHVIVTRTLFGIGVILFTLSFFIPASKKRYIPVPKTESLLSIILIGLTTFLIEAGTAFPYFAAIGLMTSEELPMYQWLPALIVYTLVMVLPAVLLFIGYRLLRKWLEGPLERLRMKLTEQSNSVLSWVMCIVGILLILNTI
ncbi:hypothetical protein GKZ89_14190 [Bacillus mangrovi]|uniref:Uncharacterized protein n=1 Tax=Metabacillus mangrovi TaxID=1491830 RepID=A0A7X2S778_9BACI|nr:GAP family protein [Metabacillus mangrovi]MTH54550.1 hypothetical protein [Metabacillus mangrovi]